jgi:hypothetical protein
MELLLVNCLFIEHAKRVMKQSSLKIYINPFSVKNDHIEIFSFLTLKPASELAELTAGPTSITDV